jgi:uncharacterized protein YihD (DUF1040 family)
MRDPNRIHEMLMLLEQVWAKDPDLRFNQLLYNLQYGYSQSNGCVGQVKEVSSDGFERVGFDLFNLEDDDFINYVRAEVESYGKESNT